MSDKKLLEAVAGAIETLSAYIYYPDDKVKSREVILRLKDSRNTRIFAAYWTLKEAVTPALEIEDGPTSVGGLAVDLGVHQPATDLTQCSCCGIHAMHPVGSIKECVHLYDGEKALCSGCGENFDRESSTAIYCNDCRTRDV